MSGRVGVFLFRPSELMDEEPPTPREDYNSKAPGAEEKRLYEKCLICIFESIII